MPMFDDETQREIRAAADAMRKLPFNAARMEALRLTNMHGCGALMDAEGLCPTCHATEESREYMRSIGCGKGAP
jgi:hypothetical protein